MSDTPPTAEEVRVATDILRRESLTWDDQSAALAALRARVDGMELGRVEAGLFQLVVDPYNDVIRAVSSRAGEGARAMTEIGDMLVKVADIYQAEDEANEHSLRGIY
ncbi:MULTISPECIES: hypothetical protein [Actinoplanes]|uniref:hypothetical protein n=1 Tax=Actinoplanes TaxID=1865 RepID=UPI0005F2F46D|nr:MULTISPECIES: hypothetical protein [Actinoplanes]GLY01716.1 hypothetical protein Acsp01_20950 [Actinoplanes sp. NBRC 101535]